MIGDYAEEPMKAATLRSNIEKYEDTGKGACYLKDARIARIIKNALLYNDDVMYHLLEWCIMPNHVHVLIEVIDGSSLSNIVQGWKSYTAHASNKVLKRRGAFWMADYFDRYIRDGKHYNYTVEYILQNPVKAGLVNLPEKWEWSSVAEMDDMQKVDLKTDAGGDARAPGITPKTDAGGDARAPGITPKTDAGGDARAPGSTLGKD
jgi:putative DNA methylase